MKKINGADNFGKIEKTDIEVLKQKFNVRKQKKRKRIIAGLIIFAAVILCAVYGACILREAEHNSLKTSAKIEISDNASIYDVVNQLKDVGAVRHKTAFLTVAKIKKLDNGFKGGTYVIKPDMKYTYILRMILAGHKDSLITFAEGLTQEQIFSKIVQSGFATEEELKKVSVSDYDYGFLNLIARENPLEGYLFPETYSISENQSAKEIINMFLTKFDYVFGEEYKKRAEEIGMSIDEVVILASVIQQETTGVENMRIVSDIFSKRLKSNDYLQSCATVQYLLKEKKNVLSAQDIKIDSPYNTYKYKGLPYGPICSPGEDAIYAALYPANSEYYYFQSDANGNMYFSKTFEEHERIRRQIQEEM